jgi:hypothetical protein
MPTLCWRIYRRRAISGPGLGEQRFCSGIDERHLARCLRGALRIAHKPIRVMLAGEPPTCSANLIGARAERHAEYLVGGAAARH